MTPADIARLPLRRVRRARIIRTESRAPTLPIVFVMPSRDEMVAVWAAWLRGGS